jgi:L-asparaginase II
VKIDDGTGRAAETVIAALLDKFGLLPNFSPARALLRAPVLNTRNETVGERRPSVPLNAIEIEALRAY